MPLLGTDWMMLTNAFNQDEVNSVTIAPLAHEIPTSDASLRKLHFSKIIWQLALGF